MTDSNLTAAELDELHADLIACRDYLVKQLGSAGEDLTVYDRAADALASLRKQLDEAQKEADEQNQSRCELIADNAKKDAALKVLIARYGALTADGKLVSRSEQYPWIAQAMDALTTKPDDPQLPCG